MICLVMYGNGVRTFMTKRSMVHTEFSEVVAGLMKNEVLWQQLEEEAIL